MAQQVVTSSSFKVPYYDQITDDRGLLSNQWQIFFRLLEKFLSSFGNEISAPIVNEQLTPTNIPGLVVDSSKISQAVVEYLIQRVTTNTNPVELLETGTFYLVYKPTSESWVKVLTGTTGPDSSGVTLTVTSTGQVQYVSTLVDGTPSISKITFRIRTLSAKNNQYSQL